MESLGRKGKHTSHITNWCTVYKEAENNILYHSDESKIHVQEKKKMCIREELCNKLLFVL